jgi:hypothetical protein
MLHPEDLAELRRQHPAGQRVRFIAFGRADRSTLAAGAEGTVVRVDAAGTVHVAWDSGHRLGMVVEGERGEPTDHIEVI